MYEGRDIILCVGNSSLRLDLMDDGRYGTDHDGQKQTPSPVIMVAAAFC